MLAWYKADFEAGPTPKEIWELKRSCDLFKPIAEQIAHTFCLALVSMNRKFGIFITVKICLLVEFFYGIIAYRGDGIKKDQ